MSYVVTLFGIRWLLLLSMQFHDNTITSDRLLVRKTLTRYFFHLEYYPILAKIYIVLSLLSMRTQRMNSKNNECALQRCILDTWYCMCVCARVFTLYAVCAVFRLLMGVHLDYVTPPIHSIRWLAQMNIWHKYRNFSKIIIVAMEVGMLQLVNRKWLALFYFKLRYKNNQRVKLDLHSVLRDTITQMLC